VKNLPEDLVDLEEDSEVDLEVASEEATEVASEEATEGASEVASEEEIEEASEEEIEGASEAATTSEEEDKHLILLMYDYDMIIYLIIYSLRKPIFFIFKFLT